MDAAQSAVELNSLTFLLLPYAVRARRVALRVEQETTMRRSLQGIL